MQIYFGLQKILGKAIPTGKGNVTWTLLRNTKTDSCGSDASVVGDVLKTYSKLSLAVCVMHEAFEPVKEIRSGRDLVEDVIFNRRQV